MSFRAIISVLYWVSLSSISWAQISWLHQRNAGWDFRGTWPSRRQPVPNCCRKNSASDWLMRMATRPSAFRTPSTDAASRCSSGFSRSAFPHMRAEGASPPALPARRRRPPPALAAAAWRARPCRTCGRRARRTGPRRRAGRSAAAAVPNRRVSKRPAEQSLRLWNWMPLAVQTLICDAANRLDRTGSQRVQCRVLFHFFQSN